ncbi:phosphoribosylformylglycinamidine synthase-like [Tubulanus polymorphus]|uniref:phosphoribosylformylglycinamidine synthase-like n=1 Tax=Tubulanus polymorphus TaxID=672921 RepID=UPI003DA2E4DD
MYVHRFYRQPAMSSGRLDLMQNKISEVTVSNSVRIHNTELCFYIETIVQEIPVSDMNLIMWMLSIPFQESNLAQHSFIRRKDGMRSIVVEIGPRLNFSTPFSTNAVSIFHSVGLKYVNRVEFSTRYNLASETLHISNDLECAIVSVIHDRMTECRYFTPIECFETYVSKERVYEVNVIGEGRKALEKANAEMGLALDAWDLDYYCDMFMKKLKRNPTNVECFDLAQSNSEHSRHWFFKGRMVVDGKEDELSLFQMVMSTQRASNQNNLIKFSDNSSCIEGKNVAVLYPECASQSSRFIERALSRHIVFTAETHNFPTGVAPFPGANTGTGGRIRDVQATGIGAHVVAGTAGYSFGNLHIPGYDLPWEDSSFSYPDNFARPVQIAIEASNGASDYGNKFGEPLLAGFARSFGNLLHQSTRREWIKPIMFSGGIGYIEDGHIQKSEPIIGYDVVKIGGPVYRIGVGGGAASSVSVQGDNKSELDLGAVQRGDAEMEQKLNRVIRACIELGENNPIRSIHDQGAGGNGNVLKEICDPSGALIHVEAFQFADPTINVLELWGAEYQESNAILAKPADSEILQNICLREKCPVSFVGNITGDGKIRLESECIESGESSGQGQLAKEEVCPNIKYPVDLDLELCLGKMPQKLFHLEHIAEAAIPLTLPDDIDVMSALNRVLRLPSVASKRYLTNKVDRSVSGLVAQQQCVGPLHTPLADVAVTALSHLETIGSATSIGEQPMKGLVHACAGARMSVAEALTNIVFAYITDIKDIKCSANWMWAAKLPGEGALLYDACKAMCEAMSVLGIAVDGGKDSLSMAARVNGETVKSPGTLVVSAYVVCQDIRLTVTPDAEAPNNRGILVHVDLAEGKRRLGGSALAQCFKQIGNSCPDLDNPALFVEAFNALQKLIKDKKICAGHDISDGGLVTCVLEMAFAGNVGLRLDIKHSDQKSAIEYLFSEELGWVLEVSSDNLTAVLHQFHAVNVPCHIIGYSSELQQNSSVEIMMNGQLVLSEKMVLLRDIWEETSFQLEKLQTNPSCVEQEQSSLKNRISPRYVTTFDMNETQQETYTGENKPKVAIIREEGSNGDREMVAALHMVGFEVWDVNMQDLCCKKVTLVQFRGVVFVGGFSYADVLGSAKGWAGTILYHPEVQAEFDAFKQREDTFSLGVCNGCQLMALLGWIAPDVIEGVERQGLLLDANVSERFESRFVTVKVHSSPSIMFKGMDESVLGIWVAHGEGRMVFKNAELEQSIIQKRLVALSYADDYGQPTDVYPFNPNGSVNGITGVCSENGRHLGMMPHPERCVLPWQLAWMPPHWKETMKVSPWLRMFKNAYIWCLETK